MVELLHADSFMIGYALFMSVINSSQAIETDPAIEVALLINPDKLVRFVVFEAAIDLEIHSSVINISY